MWHSCHQLPAHSNVSIAMSRQLVDISRALAALIVKVDEITSLKDAVSNIETSVQHMSDTYDKLIKPQINMTSKSKPYKR